MTIDKFVVETIVEHRCENLTTECDRLKTVIKALQKDVASSSDSAVKFAVQYGIESAERAKWKSIADSLKEELKADQTALSVAGDALEISSTIISDKDEEIEEWKSIADKLEKYAHHSHDCELKRLYSPRSPLLSIREKPDCTCGLTELLNAVKGE